MRFLIACALEAQRRVLSLLRRNHSTFHPPSLRRGAPIGQALPVILFPGSPAQARRREGSRRAWSCVRIAAMELTWYGRTCIRLRGRDAIVVADPYTAVVGPTGRGITGEVADWVGHPPEQLRAMKDGIARLNAEGAARIID